MTSRSDPTAVRQLRIGRPHNRRQREPGPREEPHPPGARDRRARGGEPRDTDRQPADRRTREPRERDRRDRAPRPRDRQQGRGRDAQHRKPEQKLYALESVVDRGFEDVPDESDENSTHRVHWTIVKRTVADQKSGKPMSSVYVLQRDGAEAPFPNLGAARAAVKKTIVHPEKLTLSKAEHAAAKNER